MTRPRRTKKIKRVPYGKLLKQADTVFAKYIKARDNYTCICCGTKLSEGDKHCHCGHYVKRGRKILRFNEVNCNCQDASCNWAHNNWPERYTKKLIEKWGYSAFQELLSLAEIKEVKKIPRGELEAIITTYTQRLEELKAS